MKQLVSLLSGFVFAVGLSLAGMTRPEKVIGFLDFSGPWDPSLVFVMGGGALIYAIAWQLRLRRAAPLLAPAFSKLGKAPIDRRLLVGAALFGVGWALAGVCPGPGIAALPVGGPAAVVFVVAMAAGWLLVSRVAHPLAREATR
ncbi:DUF6691 family protein [Sorangium sp. So ce1000]|uniref:DUF6691 family protein n=1 Tax=Sorangium sp. So ce1000 TaxID=3133325 RepID=UPI003F5F7E80